VTRDQIINRVLARCRRSAGDTNYVADLVAEFTVMQTTILERGPVQPWFLFKADATVDILAGGLTATLPTDFLSFPHDGNCVYLPQESGGETHYAPLERLDFPDGFGGVESAASIAGWSLQGTTIGFTEEIDATLNLLIFYYGREDLNEDAYGAGGQPAANKWCTEAADLCIGELGFIFAANYLRDKESAALMDEARKAAWTRLMTQDTLIGEGARIRVMSNWTYRPRSGVGGRIA
jgi:hypothetical protein